MVKHLIYEIECYFSYIGYYFTNVKSRPISKKIMMIKDRIKKSFLCITISLLPYRSWQALNNYVNIHIKCVMLRILLCEEKGLDALFI